MSITCIDDHISAGVGVSAPRSKLRTYYPGSQAFSHTCTYSPMHGRIKGLELAVIPMAVTAWGAFTSTTRHQKAACMRGCYSTMREPLTREANTSHVCWQTSQLHHSDMSLPKQNAAFTTAPGKPIVAMDGL